MHYDRVLMGTFGLKRGHSRAEYIRHMNKDTLQATKFITAQTHPNLSNCCERFNLIGSVAKDDLMETGTRSRIRKKRSLEAPDYPFLRLKMFS